MNFFYNNYKKINNLQNKNELKNLGSHNQYKSMHTNKKYLIISKYKTLIKILL